MNVLKIYWYEEYFLFVSLLFFMHRSLCHSLELLEQTAAGQFTVFSLLFLVSLKFKNQELKALTVSSKLKATNCYQPTSIPSVQECDATVAST